jgi:L-serine dehydratase
MKHEFSTGQDLIKLNKKYKIPISEIAKLYESESTNKSVTAIRYKMKVTRNMMYSAVKEGIKSQKKTQWTHAGGDSVKLYEYVKNMKTMMGNKVSIRAMAYALAVAEQNALMGRIVAFPTAGGAGVVPGVLFSCAEHFHAGKRKLLRGLFTASAIGMIIAKNATLSAAKGGCQAEIGAAVAMAAAGLTEMRGGTVQQCLDAAAIGLKSYLGLVCDPLGGLVEVPCIKRNALGSTAAISASDLVMAGIESKVPFDEVIDAMNNVSKQMPPSLRETALGGLAITKTGLKVKKKLGLMFKIAVLASTNGTDLQAIIDEMKAGKMPNIELSVVISNKKNAYALERAKEQGYKTVFIDPKDKTREQFDAEVADVLIEQQVDLIVLVGYMRILSKEFVRKFPKKIINVHPALIPKFCGKNFFGANVHEAVLKAGEKETGMTIHYVDEGVDTGEILLQKTCPVTPEDTAETLNDKVQALEKKWYPEVIRRLAQEI